MKSYHANSGAGIAGLTVREHDEPRPGPREALIRMRANSLNFRELVVLRGNYPLPVKVVLSEDAVVRVPEHLSFEEAATLPCAAVTAWNALTGARKLQAGDTILTLGSGAASLFALQFGRLFGARVIATTSNEEKASRLKAAGADAVINYRKNPEWHLAVRELTRGRGVDEVVDIGGSTLEQSIQSVALNGQVNFIGRLSDAASKIDINLLYNSVATLRVIFAGNRAQFIAMNRAIAVNRLKPIIDRVFPFEQVEEAFRYYEQTQPFGKVVITHR